MKKQVKGNIGKSIEERTKQEIANKTKARTIVEDKWERKKYLQECDSDTIEDVLKIRLHMWQVNCNCKRDNTDTKCPLCKKSEDTTEHVLECEKAKSSHLVKKTVSREVEWEKITEIYRKNKNKREFAPIKIQDQHKIIKENGKKDKIRKIKEKKKSRKISKKSRQKLKVRKYRKEEQKDKMIIIRIKKKRKEIKRRGRKEEKIKGNIKEDRQRMRVEESQEGKQKTKKEIEAERKIR